MNEFVRVRIGGAHTSLSRAHVEAVNAAAVEAGDPVVYEVIEGRDAVDQTGKPLPPKYKQAGDPAGAAPDAPMKAKTAAKTAAKPADTTAPTGAEA